MSSFGQYGSPSVTQSFSPSLSYRPHPVIKSLSLQIVTRLFRPPLQVQATARAYKRPERRPRAQIADETLTAAFFQVPPWRPRRDTENAASFILDHVPHLNPIPFSRDSDEDMDLASPYVPSESWSTGAKLYPGCQYWRGTCRRECLFGQDRYH